MSSTNRDSTMSLAAVAFPREADASAYVNTNRYDSPRRASKRSNAPVISAGGSHTTSASGSTSAAYTRSGVAAITRDAVSVRGTSQVYWLAASGPHDYPTTSFSRFGKVAARHQGHCRRCERDNRLLPPYA